MHEPGTKPTFESSAVQAHLGVLQNIINRMAGNSHSCKTWCITLVSAILVVMADKGTPRYMWIALVPVILFFVLDSYYLHLERCFISSYRSFSKNVRQGTVTDEQIFDVAPPKGIGTTCKGVGNSFFSFSVLPFYLVLAAVCVIAGLYLVVPPELGSSSEHEPSPPTLPDSTPQLDTRPAATQGA